MPELRWTLLILGALFIAALAWWELRRQRQAPRHGVPQGMNQGMNQGGHPGSNRESEGARPASEGGSEGRVHREPTISFPELQPEARSESRAPVRGREPAHDPPVVELDGESFAGLRVEGETGPDPDSDDDTQPEHRTEPAQSASVGYARDDDAVDDDEPQEDPQHERREGKPGEERAAAGEPIVDWPAEASRKIVALRLVSAPAARFSGREVRLALAAEGFVLGKFDIFHKPGPDARALLSAASLTKPGTFALSTIDAQRFGGLSLFAVLPGPLPAQQTFDQLLVTARALNDRLQGALQDERGEPLTPMRSASIRDSLANGQAAAAGQGAAGPSASGGTRGGGAGVPGAGGRTAPGGGAPHAESPQ